MADLTESEKARIRANIQAWKEEAATMDRAELEWIAVRYAFQQDVWRGFIERHPEHAGWLPDARVFDEVHTVIAGSVRSNQARAGGIAVHQKDPEKAAVQSAKFQVRARWEEWRSKPALYKSKVQFADAMLDDFSPVLQSQKKIMDWTRDWEKAAKR